MTEAELRERCAYWQKALRLQDWFVEVKVVRMAEIQGDDGEERGGSILRWSKDRCATIKILHSIDYPPGCLLPEDQEATLVHELLHIYTAPLDLPGSGPKQIAEEQMINALAAALVKLERRESGQEVARGVARHLLYLIENLPEGYSREVASLKSEVGWLNVTFKFKSTYESIADD